MVRYYFYYKRLKPGEIGFEEHEAGVVDGRGSGGRGADNAAQEVVASGGVARSSVEVEVVEVETARQFVMKPPFSYAQPPRAIVTTSVPAYHVLTTEDILFKECENY